VTSQGTAYSQFKRALDRRNFMLAWTMAAELAKVPLADGLELLLLARDVERRGSIGPCRAGMPGFASSSNSRARELVLAALNALPGPGVRSAVQSLAAACETHGLGREVQVLEAWIAARAAAR